MCGIMRRMHEFNFLFLVGIFLKTMQLHGTTVTKIFRLKHICCGDFNLYWSLDAVNALICALSFKTSDLVHRNESGFLNAHMGIGVERGLKEGGGRIPARRPTHTIM